MFRMVHLAVYTCSSLELQYRLSREIFLVRAISIFMSVGMVLGECEFPCEHPDFTPEPPAYAQAFDQYRVYEYIH